MEPVTSPTQPAPSTGAPVRPVSQGCCNDGSCMKGGMPIPKEVTSLLFLLFFGVSLVLAALLINEKRQTLALQQQAPVSSPAASAAPMYAFETAIPKARTYAAAQTITLPKPKTRGTLSVEQALNDRRSRRAFAAKPVTLTELSQMLWSAQGITDPQTGKRIAPSAREIYPMTVFVVVRNVSGLEPGLYEYLPKDHALGNMNVPDAGAKLTGAGVQPAAQQSPVAFLLSAAYGKGVEKMKAGAYSSALLEGGHIGQNMYLQAESLKMATVAMAGFDAKKVGGALGLDPAETIVYLYPFGHPGQEQAEE